MNPEYPPLQFAAPTTLKLKPEKPPAVPQTPLAIDARVNASRNARRILAEVTQRIRILTPEQKRAIFLRITHDRPLTKSDLAGSGLRFYSPPGATESLLIPTEVKKTEDLEFTALNQRVSELEQNEKSQKSLDFAVHMTGLEIADPKERLCPEFRADYNERIAKDYFVYEVELTSFAHSKSKQKELAVHYDKLRRFIINSGTVYEHDDSQNAEGVMRVVLSSSGAHFRALVEESEWQRVVTYFDARPKFETFSQRIHNFNIADTTIVPPPANAPRICIIDTGVAAGNPFLFPVIDREFSQSFIAGNNPLADAIGHGSGVASLAAYHLIDSGSGTTHQAVAKIVSARIMDDAGSMDVVEQQTDGGAYRVKEAHLLGNTIEKIVKTLCPHGVRIFVLSYNIIGHYWSEANRPAITRKTWVARKIDQLVKEYDILFVGITGNLDIYDLEDLHRKTPYPDYLAGSLAKLLDPGQASLAVIAGSIAHSTTVVASTDTAIAPEQAASPFTRSGPGFAYSIKPDFVELGGNSVINMQTGGVRPNMGTDVIMASGQLTPALQHNRGTSFAAPRIAHHAAQILTDLNQLGIAPSACLLRAFLAASATTPANVENGEKDRHLTVYGHGLPNGKIATDCAGHTVILFHQGDYAPGNVILLELTVPSELSNYRRGKKIIRIAIATAPSVQAWGVEDYLSVKTKFRLFRGDQSPAEILKRMVQMENENITNGGTPVSPPQTEADKSAKDMTTAFWGIEKRSVGTLQSDTFEWSNHTEAYSQNPYTLAISLKESSWCKDETIPLAVVVRLEDTTAQYTDLYATVRASVQTRVQATT